jgi:transposase
VRATAKSAYDARAPLARQQNAVINSIGANLAEFGIVAPVGRNGIEELLDRVPEAARDCV